MGHCIISALSPEEYVKAEAMATRYAKGQMQRHSLPSWPRMTPPKYHDASTPRSVDQVVKDLDGVFAATLRGETAFRRDACVAQAGKPFGAYVVCATDGCTVYGRPGASTQAGEMINPRFWQAGQFDLPCSAWRDYAPVRAVASSIRWAVLADRIVWQATAAQWSGDGQYDTARSWTPVENMSLLIEAEAVPLDDRYLWPLRGQAWRVICGGTSDPWIFATEGLAVAIMPRRR